MSKFTTGKWKAFYGEKFHTVRQAHADDEAGHDYGNGQLIAHIVQWHEGHDWANARLIAAAPDMYNMLHYMLGYVREWEKISSGRIYKAKVRKDINEVEELLAHIDGDPDVKTEESEP